MKNKEGSALLILSRESDKTVEFILPELNRHNIPWLWWDPGSLPTKSSMSLNMRDGKWEGTIDTSAIIKGSSEIDVSVSNLSFAEDIGVIWYRRPTKDHAAWETPNKELIDFVNTEVNWYLKSFYASEIIPIVCNPMKGRKASVRTLQLTVAKNLDFKVPNTYIGNTPKDIREFWEKNEKKIIVKGIHTSATTNPSGEKVGLFTSRVKKEDLASRESLRACPSIYQEEVSKDFEVRVTVVGSEVFAVEIHSQESPHTRMDWRNYDFDRTPHQIHDLPLEVEHKCQEIVEKLQLQYGAIDLVVTPKGEYVFLEINPFGQWGWLEELTEVPLRAAHARLFKKLLEG